jgi:hypothetical protein
MPKAVYRALKTGYREEPSDFGVKAGNGLLAAQ